MYQLEFCSTLGWCIVGDSPLFNSIGEAQHWAETRYVRHSLRLVVNGPQRSIVARKHNGEWTNG